MEIIKTIHQILDNVYVKMFLLLFIALGFGSYVGLTYLIDKNTRGLYKAIIKEIKDR